MTKTKFQARATKGGAVVDVSFKTPVQTTGAGSGNLYGFGLLSPAQTVSYIINFAESYQFFKVTKVHIRWVPTVGATSGGYVYAACVSNPEMMLKLYNGVYNTVNDWPDLVNSLKVSSNTPLYQPLDMSIPSSELVRRKWYSTESSTLFTAEQMDRAVPAAFMWTIYGPANTTLGYFRVTLGVEFRDFTAVTSSPMLLSTPVDFQGADGSWWRRENGIVYSIPPPSDPTPSASA